MQVGDLVRKRWGKIEPYQQDTIGIIVEDKTLDSLHSGPNLAGRWILVAYPNKRPYAHRPNEFEVVNKEKV